MTFSTFIKPDHRSDNTDLTVYLDGEEAGIIIRVMVDVGTLMYPRYNVNHYELELWDFSLGDEWAFEVGKGKPFEALRAAKNKARELLT